MKNIDRTIMILCAPNKTGAEVNIFTYLDLDLVLALSNVLEVDCSVFGMAVDDALVDLMP